MGLNNPVPGLRVIHNSNSARRVEIVVPAGDELVVSANVAAQLSAASSHFETPDPAPATPDRATETKPPARKAPARKRPAKKSE